MAWVGATDEQILQRIGISHDAFYKWKKRYQEFADALKAGKAESDGRVVKSLFQRATGYSHKDVHISNYQGEITETEITKHYPPDTTACIFWLKNRMPAQWRDKIDVNAKVEIDSVGSNELARRLAYVLANGANDVIEGEIVGDDE